MTTGTDTHDEAAFARAANAHRRELVVHLYRMTGNLHEAEDLVQEVFLRAWTRRDQARELRPWLYKVATNACLDHLRAKRREPLAAGQEALWLTPIPDTMLDELAPHEAAVARETIELAFVVAIQHLAPLQRAVFVLRDVLGWSARETAELLETSEAAVNSAMQRAKAILRDALPAERSDWPAPDQVSPEQHDLLERYVAACDAGDAEAVKDTLHEDVRFSMPPEPLVVRGRDDVVGSWVQGGFGSTMHLRCRITHGANRQPAIANWRVLADGTTELLAIDVLTVRDGRIVDVTAFFNERDFAAFGLEPTL
jgi:RNA polymerase sigma-70 factor (ECF subfamily)